MSYTRRKNQNICIAIKSNNDVMSSREFLSKLLDAGANVIRYVLVDEDLAWNRDNIQNIRKIALDRNKKISIIMDLHGNLPTIGSFIEGSAILHKDATFVLDTNKTEGTSQRIFLNKKDLLYQILPGMRLIIGNGSVELMVTETTATQITTLVLKGGVLTDYQVVNPINFVAISSSKLTARDLIGIQLVKEMSLEAVAYPTVEPSDLLEINKSMLDTPQTCILAKLASSLSLKNIEDIAELADGFILVRDTLAYTLSHKLIGSAQNYVLEVARKKSKLCMLTLHSFSYDNTPTPDIAFVTDINNIVLSSASGWILSSSTEGLLATIQLLSSIYEQIEFSFSKDIRSEHPLFQKILHLLKGANVKLLLIHGAEPWLIKLLSTIIETVILISAEQGNYTLYPNIYIMPECFYLKNQSLHNFCVEHNLLQKEEHLAIIDVDHESLNIQVCIPQLSKT